MQQENSDIPEDNSRKKTIIGSIVILALIVACVATVRLNKLAVPEHIDRDTINIGAADYEAALARWNGAAVEEYQIATEIGDEQVTLRINQAEKSMYVLEHLRRDGYDLARDPNTALGSEAQRTYAAYTVDGLFSLAKERLDVMLALNGEKLESSTEDFDYFHDYVLRFDPTLGYPTFIVDHLRTAHRLRELIWRQAGSIPVEVKSFKVLK